MREVNDDNVHIHFLIYYRNPQKVSEFRIFCDFQGVVSFVGEVQTQSQQSLCNKL